MACCCGGDCGTTLIYSCSGAANTGLLADQLMRNLARYNVGKSTCLAAVGAGLSGFVESARSASRNIVIDGCPTGCGKRIFEDKGLPFTHYTTTDFDVKKGETPITDNLIADLTAKIAADVQTRE